MCFGSPGFETSLLFLETKTGKMSKLVASFISILFSWALKSLYVSCITAFWTSILVFMCALGIKSLLVLALNLVTFTAMLLVICVFRFHRWLLFLYFPAGNSVHWCLRKLICMACGSPVTCFVWCAVALELSILFASWHTLPAGNLLESTLPLLMVLDTNSLSHKKTQKMSLWRILAVSGGI